jgi:hypothetical protein
LYTDFKFGDMIYMPFEYYRIPINIPLQTHICTNYIETAANVCLIFAVGTINQSSVGNAAVIHRSVQLQQQSSRQHVTARLQPSRHTVINGQRANHTYIAKQHTAAATRSGLNNVQQPVGKVCHTPKPLMF